jgi:hypothetical protein
VILSSSVFPDVCICVQPRHNKLACFKHFYVYPGKERASFGESWAAPHLRKEWAILEFGAVRAFGHLLEDAAVGHLALERISAGGPHTERAGLAACLLAVHRACELLGQVGALGLLQSRIFN